MTQARWLNETEDQAWRGLRRVELLVLARINKDLHTDSGLSVADYDVLTALSEREPRRTRLKDLAASTHWSPSRLSHHISRMEDRGLVIREAAAEDGRGSCVMLTDHGMQVLQNAAPLHVESVRERVFDQLTAEQVAQLAEITAALLHPATDGR